MKKLILSLLLAVGLIGSASAAPPTNAPATVKPLWTCTFPNAIQFSTVTTKSWLIHSSKFDSNGNAAILIYTDYNITGYYTQYNILFISSKGVLLGTIQCGNHLSRIAIVNSNSFTILDSSNSNNPIMYTSTKKGLIESDFPNGNYNLECNIGINAPGAIIGITQTNQSGNPTALSFFH